MDKESIDAQLPLATPTCAGTIHDEVTSPVQAIRDR